MVYKSENIINIYSNRFKTEWTDADLRIRFGEIMFSSTGKSTGKHLVIEERVGVTMTWLMAKELRDHLDLLVTKYEAANWELRDGVIISTKPEAPGNTEPIPEDEESEGVE